MILDSHTHAFPAEFVAARARLLREEPVFAELYASPRARMATAADLLRAMDEDGVAVAVALGFAWHDRDRCRAHNDALLAAAAHSGGRLLAGCAVPRDPAAVAAEVERCAAAGAVALGELRPDSLGIDLARDPWGMAVAEAARAAGLPVVLHASEPVGHDYPGKRGGDLASIWAWLTAHPDLTVVLAHLGGGLPFYAAMPEVQAAFARLYIDTAAVPWLYQPRAYRTVIDLIGADRILFGSDFPLRRAARDVAVLRGAGLTAAELDAILGRNAARLYGWPGGDVT